MEGKQYELLEKIYAKVEALDTKVEGLDTKVEGLDTKVDKMDEEIQGLKTEVQEIKMTMATKEDLELAVEELKAEGQMIYDEVKELRQDFNVMEIMVNKNALDISKIKLAR